MLRVRLDFAGHLHQFNLIQHAHRSLLLGHGSWQVPLDAIAAGLEARIGTAAYFYCRRHPAFVLLPTLSPGAQYALQGASGPLVLSGNLVHSLVPTYPCFGCEIDHY